MQLADPTYDRIATTLDALIARAADVTTRAGSEKMQQQITEDALTGLELDVSTLRAGLRTVRASLEDLAVSHAAIRGQVTDLVRLVDRVVGMTDPHRHALPDAPRPTSA